MASKKKNEQNEQEQSYSVPKGFGNLDDVRVDLAGFYSPKEDRLAPGGDHVFGTLVKYVERRDARRNQAEGFIIVILAAPVIGLVFEEDGKGTEGTLEEGWAVGIDIRGAYKMLAEPQYEGKKIHLHFKKKKPMPDGNEFWETGVQVEGGIVRVPRRGGGTGQGIPQEDIPF